MPARYGYFLLSMEDSPLRWLACLHCRGLSSLEANRAPWLPPSRADCSSASSCSNLFSNRTLMLPPSCCTRYIGKSGCGDLACNKGGIADTHCPPCAPTLCSLHSASDSVPFPSGSISPGHHSLHQSSRLPRRPGVPASLVRPLGASITASLHTGWQGGGIGVSLFSPIFLLVLFGYA